MVHCALLSDVLKSASMFGIATLSAVKSFAITNTPRLIATSASQVSRPMASGVALGAFTAREPTGLPMCAESLRGANLRRGRDARRADGRRAIGRREHRGPGVVDGLRRRAGPRALGGRRLHARSRAAASRDVGARDRGPAARSA